MNPPQITQTCAKSNQVGEEVDLADVDAMVARIGRRAEDLIPLLQALVHEQTTEAADFRRVLERLGTHDAQEAAVAVAVAPA